MKIGLSYTGAHVGAILSEKLRSVSLVKGTPNIVIKYENDPLKIVELDQDARTYFSIRYIGNTI